MNKALCPPPIINGHASVHEIGSHIPGVADRYPRISPIRNMIVREPYLYEHYSNR